MQPDAPPSHPHPAHLASAAPPNLAGALDGVARRLRETLGVDVVVLRVDDADGGTAVGCSAHGPAALLAERLEDPARWEGELGVGASVLSTPLHTAYAGDLGIVALVNLTQERPLNDGHATRLHAVAPEVSLEVHNHQLTARNRYTRQMLEGVIASSPMGVMVTDLHGRLSLANAAAAEMLGVDVAACIGQRTTALISERLKWRFTNPDAHERRMLAAHTQHSAELEGYLEALDGRTLKHVSSPVHDAAGALAGRMDMFSDVTDARASLAEAQQLASERAVLLEREERRAQEEVALSRAAHMMASALSPADVHDHLLEQAAHLVPACEKCAVLVSDRRGVVTAAAVRGFSPATAKRMVFRANESAVGRTMASGRPFICNDTATETGGPSAITAPEGIRSFMHVPIVVGDRTYGLVSVNSSVPRAFGERELRVVGELTRHASAALQNALQFAQERHIADTLQRALVAADLPVVPGLELAALYRPAAGVQVGGDICAAWRLPGGAVVILIGDVSGRGIEAAGLAAMVRYMAEALSRHHGAPGSLVTELNDLLKARLPDGSLVTLAMTIVDPVHGELGWTNAGHPAPVLIRRDGELTTFDDPGPPCGAFAGQRFTEHRTGFEVGDLLVLYTDGITEARSKGREFGERALHTLLGTLAHTPTTELPSAVVGTIDDWCDAVLHDDVAIAVMRNTGAQDPTAER